MILQQTFDLNQASNPPSVYEALSCIPLASRLVCLFANLLTKSIFHGPFLGKL